MLHIRATVPPERADEITAALAAHAGVAHVVHLPAAGIEPAGDVVLCDVAREAANEVVEWLQDHGVHRTGAIALEPLHAVVSDRAAAAVQAAPGHGADALVWEEVEAKVRDEAALTGSGLVLMAVAVGIAAVGILLDSPILIVGAMVVGPDYGPLAGICVAAVRGRGTAALGALRTLGAMVLAGSVAAVALVAGLRASGLAPDGYEVTERQATAFIAHPDGLAVVVAVLAGIAGMLALTEARAGTLVGVLVSVTTIPAIANLGVAAAYGAGDELLGSAAQLGLNLLGLVVAGCATLLVQARLARAPALPPRR